MKKFRFDFRIQIEDTIDAEAETEPMAEEFAKEKILKALMNGSLAQDVDIELCLRDPEED